MLPDRLDEGFGKAHLRCQTRKRANAQQRTDEVPGLYQTRLVGPVACRPKERPAKEHGGDGVEVAIFRRIGWPLEEVEHPFGDQETAKDV